MSRGDPASGGALKWGMEENWKALLVHRQSPATRPFPTALLSSTNPRARYNQPHLTGEEPSYRGWGESGGWSPSVRHWQACVFFTDAPLHLWPGIQQIWQPTYRHWQRSTCVLDGIHLLPWLPDRNLLPGSQGGRLRFRLSVLQAELGFCLSEAFGCV